MEKIRITSLADCKRNPGALTLDALRADAKRTNAPHVVEATDTRFLVVCPGGSVMGTSQTYSNEEAYDLAFWTALQRDWALPVRVEGIVGL